MKKSYTIFNETDGLPASPVKMTKEEAEKFLVDFPKRFEKQGYYLTSNGERILPQAVVLKINEAK